MIDHKMEYWSTKVLRNVQRATDIFEIEMTCPFDAKLFLPGQFICLAPLAEGSVMSRPFSIRKIFTAHGNSFSILVKYVGENTDLITNLKKGDEIKVWGPCGQSLPESFFDFDKYWLIGGGIGIAPPLFFEHVLWLKKKEVRVLYGNKTAKEAIKLELCNNSPGLIATDDGSEGYSGFITDAFLEMVEKEPNKNTVVIACGPVPMMRQAFRISKEQGLTCYVILEKTFACGIGSCLGCSIKTTNGMKRVCHDGPIFDGKEILWDELS